MLIVDKRHELKLSCVMAEFAQKLILKMVRASSYKYCFASLASLNVSKNQIRKSNFVN